MLPPWFGEFMGTLVLILLGDGVVAGVLLKKSKGENSGWKVITAGWAFAVMCGVFTAIACSSPEAHINPAVTVAVAIRSGDFSHLLPFFLAQVSGAFVGAALVWIHYLPHWRETPIHNFLMQFQADILNIPVLRPAIKETTALGAAYAAGLAVGYCENLNDLRQNWTAEQTWEPHMEKSQCETYYLRWKKAVTRSFDWVV